MAPRDPSQSIPTGRVRRATKTTTALAPSSAKLIGSLAASLARSPESAQEILERRHMEIAEQAVTVLAGLRGGAMKIGQLASFIDVEFLPPQYRTVYQEKLASLRDSAPPMSWKTVRRVLEREWERPPESLFEEIEHDAVAAASIGQVHRGVLPDGRRVAIKVQYPEIADAVEADLGTAAILIRLGKALAPGLDPEVVAGELRERIMEELDYELEAQHQRVFARAYRGHPFVHVPEPVTSLSRRRVLVSEWVDGRPFAKMLELPQGERNRIGEILVRFFFGSMYHVRRFNTDAHPGNYLLMDDGRVAFLDFGCVKLVEERSLAFGRRAITAALRGDATTFREEVDKAGYVHRADRIDDERLLRQSLAISEWYLLDREVAIDPEYVARVVGALADPAQYPLARQLKVPPEEIWLRRMETSVLAVLGHLRASANWHRMARENVFGDAPSTPLGEAEQAFWARRS